MMWQLLPAAGLMVVFLGGAGDEPKGKEVDAKTKAIEVKLKVPIELKFDQKPLEDVLNFIKKASTGPNDSGIPIYVDPVGLQESETTMTTKVTIESKKGEPLGSSLKRLLKSIGLGYHVKDGLLTITSIKPLADHRFLDGKPLKKGEVKIDPRLSFQIWRRSGSGRG